MTSSRSLGCCRSKKWRITSRIEACLHLMFMFTDVCACETRRREVDEACPDSQSTDAVTPGKKKKKEFRLDSNDFGFI